MEQPLVKNDLPGGQPTAVPLGHGSLLPGVGSGSVTRFRGNASLSPPPLPPQASPGPKGVLGASTRPTVRREQVHAPVVILLRWKRHAVQRVMRVEPLLLFQSQALQLS